MSPNVVPPVSVQNDEVTISRLAAIGQISAGIAHEVRNPLTAVKGFLQLLQESTPHAYVEFASQELDRAIETLENLLNVSKPDLDEEHYLQLNLCSEIESILYLFQDKAYDVPIETKFTSPNVLVTGKRNQLKKAFFNLIKNAFEAISGHGVIRITQECVGRSFRVTISDTGRGIPEDEIALLGTPFYTTKVDGTGMGLAQVFSTIYQHGGTITVSSVVGKGTTFVIEFPTNETKHQLGVNPMTVEYHEGMTFKSFYDLNEHVFVEELRKSGKELFENINGLSTIDEEYVIDSAKAISGLVNDENEHGLTLEARIHGKNWARHNLNLILKLEWFQVLRKLYMDLLYSYYEKTDIDLRAFADLTIQVNYLFDTYLKHFSSSFSELKNEQIQSQIDLIDDLSVPVIPVTNTTAILPIVGMIDTYRAKRIQETVLSKISELHLTRLIIDMSGVAFMDTAVAGHMFRIIEGISLLGCKAILTGLRPEIVHTIIELGISLTDKVETIGTLQQAMEKAGLI